MMASMIPEVLEQSPPMHMVWSPYRIGPIGGVAGAVQLLRDARSVGPEVAHGD